MAGGGSLDRQDAEGFSGGDGGSGFRRSAVFVSGEGGGSGGGGGEGGGAGGDGFPLPFIAPFVIRFTRGVRPYTFTIRTWNEQLVSLKNPCKFTIYAPSRKSGQPNKLVTSGWYLIAARLDTASGTWAYTFADVRWRLAAERFSKPEGYNVISFQGVDGDLGGIFPEEGESYRPESLNLLGGGAPGVTPANVAPGGLGRWSLFDAVSEVIQTVAEQADIKDAANIIDENASLADELRQRVLPSNIGNSKTGGWFGASFGQVVSAMLREVNADLALTPQGKLAIVGRSGKATWVDAFVKGEPGMLHGASVGKGYNHWTVPERLVVQFQRRIERRLEAVVEESNTVTPPDNNQLDPIIENICPRWDLDEPAPKPDAYRKWKSYVEDVFGSNAEAKFWAGFWKPQPLKIGSGTTFDGLAERAKKARALALAKKTFRMLWRPRNQTDNDIVRLHALSNVAIGGRLMADGSTSDEGGVRATYIEVLRAGSFNPAQGDDPFSWDFTRTYTGPQIPHPVSGATPCWAGEDAPFSVRMIDPFRFVFLVEPRNEDIMVERLVVGMNEPDGNGEREARLLKGTLADAIRGNTPIKDLESQQLSNAYTLRVYYNGLHTSRRVLLDESSGATGLREQVYEIEVPLTHDEEGGDSGGQGGGGQNGGDAFADGRGKLNGGKPQTEPGLSRLVLAVNNITANYRFPDRNNPEGLDEGAWPGILLNEEQLDERAQSIAEQVVEAYKIQRRGALHLIGISDLAEAKDGSPPDKLGVWGEVHEVAVAVGKVDAFDIETVVTVAPAPRTVGVTGEKRASRELL